MPSEAGQQLGILFGRFALGVDGMFGILAVVPVIAALAGDGATVSVDTMRSEVALAAVTAGARIVNDVSGGLADPRMHEVVAASGAAYVAMHWRAHSDTMQQHASYEGPGGVVAAVRDELAKWVR